LALLFLVASYLLLCVHELGHFVVGSSFGLTYELFSVGSGPVLFHTFLDSGLEVNFGLYPTGGVCVLTDASAAEMVTRPAYQPICVFVAGVLSSGLITWLVFGLSVRLSGDGRMLKQVWRSFLLSLGVIVISPLLPLITLSVLLSRTIFERCLSCGIVETFSVIRANQRETRGFASRSWIIFAVLMFIGNLYLGLINASPLDDDLDGYKAAYFLMISIDSVIGLHLLILYWFVCIIGILALVPWRIGRAIYELL
jgi:hypothetical protein